MAIDKITTPAIADGAVSADTLTSTVITGQTAETSIATDDLILLSDTSASGALKKMTRANFVSGVGGTMTPAFQATAPGDQAYSDTTTTVIPANNVSDDGNYNINNAYNTSNYRFTPQVAGKYFCYIQLTASNNAQNLKRALTSIRKNSTNHYQDFLMPDSSNYTYKMGVFQGLVLNLNGDTDYFEATLYLDGTSGNLSTDYSRIGAYRIIT